MSELSEMSSPDNSEEEKKEVNQQHRLGWGKFLLFFLTYIGLTLGFTIILIIFYTLFSDISDLANIEDSIPVYLMLSVDFAAFLITLFIFKSARQFLKGTFSFAPLKSWKTYVYIVGAIVVVYVSQYLILEVFKIEDGADQVETFNFDALSFTSLSVLLLFVSMAILTPIKEEILFRGLLHGFIAKRWHFLLGLFISSIIFGLLHGGHAISTTIMGIVFVLLYKLTRTLIVPIIFHMIWNVYAVISLVLYTQSIL